MYIFEYFKFVPSPEGKKHYRPKFDMNETREEFSSLPKAIERFTKMFYSLEDGVKIEGDPQTVVDSSKHVVFSRDYLGDSK